MMIIPVIISSLDWMGNRSNASWLTFRTILLSISMSWVLVTGVLMGAVYRFRRLKVFRVASPIFLCTTLVGCAIMYGEVRHNSFIHSFIHFGTVQDCFPVKAPPHTPKTKSISSRSNRDPKFVSYICIFCKCATIKIWLAKQASCVQESIDGTAHRFRAPTFELEASK